jgi:hypothetical protein
MSVHDMRTYCLPINKITSERNRGSKSFKNSFQVWQSLINFSIGFIFETHKWIHKCNEMMFEKLKKAFQLFYFRLMFIQLKINKMTAKKYFKKVSNPFVMWIATSMSWQLKKERIWGFAFSLRFSCSNQFELHHVQTQRR